MACINKRTIQLALNNNLGYSIEVHSNCQCNQIQSLVKRHLIDRTYIQFDARYFDEYKRSFMQLLPKHVQRSDPLSIVKRYSGVKRRWYSYALTRLAAGHCNHRVTMFVKPDKYSSADIYDKAPRAIQYRSREYNLLLATYLAPYEELLYPGLQFGLHGRHIVKGLNNFERAELFLAKVKQFKDPVFLELDHSKFDSTLRTEHLRFEHACYKRAFPRCPQLVKLLKSQLFNVGYAEGIKYTVKGTRMSGDFNTGLGNSLINAYVLYSLGQRMGGPFDCILDGDDSVVIVERADADRWPRTFHRMGFETKFKMTDNIHQVDFCQCRFMSVPVPNFVRSPLRVLSHTMVLRKRRSKFGSVIRGYGHCEAALNPGIPIISVYGKTLRGVGKYVEGPYKYKMARVRYREYPISEQARWQFWQCWGISPTLQEAFETSLQIVIFGDQDSDTVKNCQKLCDEPPHAASTSHSCGFSALPTTVDAGWSRLGSEYV